MECTIGLLKARFPILYVQRLESCLKSNLQVINACAILHNLFNNWKLDLLNDELELDDVDSDGEDDDEYMEAGGDGSSFDSVLTFRNEIANKLWDEYTDK